MEKRTVLITGCSTGIGRTTARQFGEAGWQVAATMRDTAAWQSVHASADTLVLRLNTDDNASVEEAFHAASARFGKIDCVVNNAGRSLLSVFEVTPMEAIRAIFETNLFGYMRVMQTAIPYFKQAGGGRFINVSSGSGIVPEPLMSIYGASKHAVEGFTESVAYELATQNIVVKLIEPGQVTTTNFMQQTQKNSEQIPMPDPYQSFFQQTLKLYTEKSPDGLATEADVARAILTAATEDSSSLRTLVGDDARKFAHMRWETSEAEYERWTSSIYASAAQP